jgi:hypothetical protein
MRRRLCRDYRFRLDAVPTDGIARHCKGRNCRRGRLPGIDLLERDDSGWGGYYDYGCGYGYPHYNPYSCYYSY